MVSAQDREKLYHFIRNRTQGVIATVCPDDKPEAALMDIAVTTDLEIIFETTDQTRKFANLTARPAVSFVVGWGEGETLQYDGTVHLLAGTALEKMQQLYLATFPQKASHPNWPGNYYFLARPSWIRYSDYRMPRKIEEFRFDADISASPKKGWWNKLVGMHNA